MVSKSSVIQILIFVNVIDEILAGPTKTAGMFHQTDYSVTLEKHELPFLNKSYVEFLEVNKIVVNGSETKYSLSASLLESLNAEYLDLRVEARKFKNGEYQLLPFAYTENTCDALKFPKFGNYLEKYDCNFKRSCDIKKGTYSCKGIYVDDSQYPPFAPRGKFKLVMYLTYNKKILLGIGEYFIEIKSLDPSEQAIGVE